MSKSTVNVHARDCVRRLVLVVKVRGLKTLTIRFRVAALLFRFAALVAGIPITIVMMEEQNV